MATRARHRLSTRPPSIGDGEAHHHAGIFMFQQVAVGHVRMFAAGRMVKTHQHFTAPPFDAHRVLPAAAMPAGGLPFSDKMRNWVP